MKIVCVGGGPAGLYFGILSKLRDPDSDVLVVEKNPRGAVTGWGTVFWYDLLLGLPRTDRAIAVRIREAANQWDAQRVRADGKSAAQLGGHGFSIGRAVTLEILTERALSLGARIDCEPARLPDAELAVASDGAASHVRAPSWLANCGRTWGPPGSSTRSPFHSSGPPPAGYGFTPTDSTPTPSPCIVECPPQTWHGLGIGERAPHEFPHTLADISPTTSTGSRCWAAGAARRRRAA